MNAFDGVMTILGMVIAAYFTDLQDTAWLISSGIGICIAMGISGFSGAYITEESEKSKELSHLEKHMLKDLKNTVIGRASKFASFWAAFIDGLSPSLGALISLSPFFISRSRIISIQTALNLSIILSFILLFLLGTYLGKISERNMIIHGIKTLFAGFSVAAILFLLNLT